tara:strand:+ start:60424 stop:61617 length:1194 start_codon:yes stop_codon:yes gene_type:complete
LRFRSDQFKYQGEIDDSKSIVNRLLIVQSHYKNLKLNFASQAEDVLYLQQALRDLEQGLYEFDLGSGGTTFRFFLARLSRQPGRYIVRAHAKLLERPQRDLYRALEHIGTLVTSIPNGLSVTSLGWKNISLVNVKSDLSSQFASAILANCWNLDHDFTIDLGKEVASKSFLDLTQNVCQRLGMKINTQGTQLKIPAHQRVKVKKLDAEVDASSLFTLTCFALLFGELKVKPCTNKFGQPDFQFLNFFKDWGINYKLDSKGFSISKQDLPKFAEVNLKNCPDLFPVLAAFLSFCPGMHKLYGAPHLVNKESNRIAKTYELLTLAGVQASPLADGMIIEGNERIEPKKFAFDPDNDHRMAFAAALFGFAGFEVDLAHRHVVNKSFPQFWNILGLENDGD